MENLSWGLQMMLIGMGTVFLMLIALMLVLMLLGRTDKEPAAIESAPEPAELPEVVDAEPVTEEPTAWMTIADASGLTPEQIAAVSVAVAVHADLRRKQAAPSHRVHAPGSRLWASRWVAMGRQTQMHNTQRR